LAFIRTQQTHTHIILFMSIARERRQSSSLDRSINSNDKFVVVDDLIDVLSSLLESSGFLTNKNNNNNNNNSNNNDNNNNNSNSRNDNDKDPHGRLSRSLKELIISLEKLHKLVFTGKATEVMKVDDTITITTNGLLLIVENVVHRVRTDAENLSTLLPKSISLQLKLCRKFESISRNNKRLSTLLPMAKSLAGAVRQQKALWLQSIQMIEKCMDEIYSRDPTEMKNNLQIVYRRVLRRCVDHDRSPWKEAVGLLEYIVRNEIPAVAADNEFQEAIFINSPSQTKDCSILPLPSSSHVARSNCTSSQIHNMIEDFLSGNLKNDEDKSALSILVFGPEGYGKTFLLDEIKNNCRAAGVDVLNPLLPFDAIGTTVGATEEIIISLICYAKTKEGKCVLLLDDIDSIFGQTESTIREPHQTSRSRQLFFSLLEIIQERNYEASNGQMILICSSKVNFGQDIDRFDKILQLLQPNKEERKNIISYYIAEHDVQHIGCSDISVVTLVECTLGLSRAELSHYCREALISLQSRRESSGDTNNFLGFLKQKLQSSTPESLKYGVNEDFVDMKVFSARDLQKLYPIHNQENPIANLPLFGESAKATWRELRRLIVMPVCQGLALDKIMYHRGGRTDIKSFAGGVLLSALPGCGKTTLSYFCAAFASSINHSVKLIDVSCTSLIHKEVGGSERALHRFFRSARSATPCIVVMDGIENIAAVRGNDNTTEGTMDRLLSTLLTELDGVESDVSMNKTPGCMVIIGITHNVSWIDPALRRPGRLERTLWLDSPDLEGRKQIIVKELGHVIFEPDQAHPELQNLDDLANRLALETEGYTGAGVISICNESKLLAFNNFFKGDGVKEDYITPQIVFEAANSQRPDGRD